MEEINKTDNTPKEAASRPLVLTLLCLFSFVFFGLASVLFLLALLWSGSIADMVLRYAPEQAVNRVGVLFYILGGLLFHSVSFAGTILIWKMRRAGYLIFGTSSLIIAAYQLFATQFPPLPRPFI